MCHNPAIIFSTLRRVFIRKGYKADFALVVKWQGGQVVKRSNLPVCADGVLSEGIEFKMEC